MNTFEDRGISHPPYRLFDHIRPDRVTWWVWSVIAVLLLFGLVGDSMAARQVAMAVTIAQSAVWLVLNRDLDHFPTQLRLAYAIWMALSFVPALTFMFWIQTAGTAALILTGYCPLARLLLIFPWNRRVPLNWRRLVTIAFHPPIKGSVRTGLPL